MYGLKEAPRERGGPIPMGCWYNFLFFIYHLRNNFKDIVLGTSATDQGFQEDLDGCIEPPWEGLEEDGTEPDEGRFLLLPLEPEYFDTTLH
jgi:hypothetical protein